MGKKGACLAGLAFAAALAAGCSSAPMSAATAARSAGPAADAALVCHHYMTQRAWIRGVAQPTAADALKFISDVAADVAQSPAAATLHADLAALAKAQRGDGPVYAASTRVYNDCAAIGVTSG